MAKNDWDDVTPGVSPVSCPSGVHRKLMAARLDLQGRTLKKSGHNKFAGYHYFELGDFLPVVQEIFAGLGLSGIVSYGSDIATLTITDVDDGSNIVITSPMSTAALKGCHEVQNLGAVQTYVRRYLWVTALEIVEHDALDATTGQQTRESFKKHVQNIQETEPEVVTPSDAWMIAQADTLTKLHAAGDVYGAYAFIKDTFKHPDGGTNVELVERLWQHVDSTPRNAIRACSAIVHAKSVESLEKVWAATPKHAIAALTATYEQRKAELSQQMEAAA